jgi:hypothetical protein
LLSSLILAGALNAVPAGPAAAGLVGIGGDNVLYDVSTSTGALTNPRPVGNKVNMIAFSSSGTLYGVSQGTPTDIPPGGRLFTINTGSGTPTLVATLDTWVFTEGDIAFDPSSGLLYAVDSGGQLWTIHTTTGVGTVIGSIAPNFDLSAMAFDAVGDLYVVNSFGPTLLKVNKNTAAIISTVALAPVNQEVGGLAFDPGSGTLYHASGFSSFKLSTVVPGTGAATDVGPLGVSIWGLTFVPQPTPARSSTWGRVKALYR